MRWSKQVTPNDIYLTGCRAGNPNCPEANGPEAAWAGEVAVLSALTGLHTPALEPGTRRCHPARSLPGVRGLLGGPRRLRDGRDRALGAGVTYAVMLHGVAQHYAYHAGQIALLKKGV